MYNDLLPLGRTDRRRTIGIVCGQAVGDKTFQLPDDTTLRERHILGFSIPPLQYGTDFWGDSLATSVQTIPIGELRSMVFQWFLTDSIKLYDSEPVMNHLGNIVTSGELQPRTTWFRAPVKLSFSESFVEFRNQAPLAAAGRVLPITFYHVSNAEAELIKNIRRAQLARHIAIGRGVRWEEAIKLVPTDTQI